MVALTSSPLAGRARKADEGAEGSPRRTRSRPGTLFCVSAIASVHDRSRFASRGTRRSPTGRFAQVPDGRRPDGTAYDGRQSRPQARAALVPGVSRKEDRSLRSLAGGCTAPWPARDRPGHRLCIWREFDCLHYRIESIRERAGPASIRASESQSFHDTIVDITVPWAFHLEYAYDAATRLGELN